MPIFDHFDFLAPLYETFIRPEDPQEMWNFADLSYKMLSEARQKDGLRPVCSHTEKLPFPGKTFARIIMVDTLHHVIDQRGTLDELWRTLQPGGRLVIEEPDLRLFDVKLLALAEKLAIARSGYNLVMETQTRYGQEGFSAQSPDIPAYDWLNVEPSSKLLSDIALASVAIALLGIAGKESGIMGFILFTAASIAFSVAAVISIVVGAVGVALYIWRGRGSQRTRRVFWYSLFGVVLVGTIIINVIPFPQAPAGSNYSELANEWIIKAVVYALIPGVACLLGGITSLFARMRETKD